MPGIIYRERGQSLTLLALGLVGLLGFSALAVDGGMLYLDRRTAQNAADAAAMAGAMAIDGGEGNWHSAALDRAASNGFDNDGDSNVVAVHSPPSSGPYAGDSNAVQVVITSTINTSFAHMIFNAPLQGRVEAVARNRPSGNLAGGTAIFGNNLSECSTVWFSGNQDTNVVGGDVFSNSLANSDDCASGKQNGDGAINVDGGSINVVGSFFKAGSSGSVNPTPNEGVSQQSLPIPPTPNCSGLPWWGPVNVSRPRTLRPGIYTRINITNGALVLMEPGMYCITGSQGFSAQGGSITGEGVFLYLVSGPFDVAGGVIIELSANEDLQDASGNDWSNMLIYYHPDNDSAANIRGHANSMYTGTILAPASRCDVAGTSDTLSLYSQILCDTVHITGDAAVTIIYNESEQYAAPPMLELVQ
jgi:hypothetical protein